MKILSVNSKVNEILQVNVLLEKKNFYKKTLQKQRPGN